MKEVLSLRNQHKITKPTVMFLILRKSMKKLYMFWKRFKLINKWNYPLNCLKLFTKLSTNFWKQKVSWLHPAMVCLITSSIIWIFIEGDGIQSRLSSFKYLFYFSSTTSQRAVQNNCYIEPDFGDPSICTTYLNVFTCTR